VKWLLAIVILLAGLLAGAYASLPWLAETLALREAAAVGIEVRELDVRFPRWGEIAVDRLVASMQGNELRAEQLSVAYNWSGVRERRLAFVGAALLTVYVEDSSGDAEPGALGEQIVVLPGLFLDAWQELPVESVQVDEVRLRTGELVFAGTFGFTPAAASLAGEVSGVEPLGALRLSMRADAAGSVGLAIQQLERPANSLAVSADARRLAGEAVIAWNLELPVEDGELAVTLEGRGPIELSENGWRLGSGLQARVDGGAWRGGFAVAEAEGPWPEDEAAELVRVSGAWQLEAELPHGVAARGTLSAGLDRSGAKLSIDPGMVVTGAAVSGASWSLEGIRLDTLDGLALEVGIEPMTLTLGSPVRAALAADAARWENFALAPYVDLRIDSLAMDPGGARGAFAATVPALQLSASGQIRADAESSTMVVELSARQRLRAPLLATFLAGWDQPYDVDAGNVAVTGSLTLGDGALSGDVVVTLEGVQSHYGEVVAAGIAGEARVKLREDGWQATADTLSVAVADPGFPLRDLRFAAELTPATALLSAVRGRALGGELFIDRLAYDMNDATAAFLVIATGIELADVLALEGESVTGSGILDGELPVELLEGGTRITNGRFLARAPGGVLRYPDAGKAAEALGQQVGGFALAPLVDFRFEVLDAHVDLQPSGDLLLGVRLEGRSPEFERPYHYNLNISENIPALLKSLRISEEFQRRLEEVLQR
jgi:hypothetical protein